MATTKKYKYSPLSLFINDWNPLPCDLVADSSHDSLRNQCKLIICNPNWSPMCLEQSNAIALIDYYIWLRCYFFISWRCCHSPFVYYVYSCTPPHAMPSVWTSLRQINLKDAVSVTLRKAVQTAEERVRYDSQHRYETSPGAWNVVA